MHVRMRTADRRVSPWQQHDYSREPGKAKLEDTKTISATFMLGFAVMNVSDLYTSAGIVSIRIYDIVIQWHLCQLPAMPETKEVLAEKLREASLRRLKASRNLFEKSKEPGGL